MCFLVLLKLGQCLEPFHSSSVRMHTTVSILLLWKANGFYARGSVIAFKIAPPCEDGCSYNFMHSKRYKFCKVSDWICTVE